MSRRRTVTPPRDPARGAVSLHVVDVTEGLRRESRREHVRLEKQVRELSRRLVLARENERRRIARDFHDQIGHTLTALKYLIEAGATGGKFDHVLDEIRTLIDQVMGQVTDLTLDLCPAALDRLGLLPALSGDLERFTARTRIQVDLTHAGLERRLPPEVETAAYRVVQEALTNVARHAGVARATVGIRADEHLLSVEVADEGDGFDVEDTLRRRISAGFSGMRERVTALGGSLTIDSSPGAGTRILVDLPLR